MSFQFHGSAFQIQYKKYEMPVHNFRYRLNDNNRDLVPCYVICPKILKFSEIIGNMMHELCSGDKFGSFYIYEAYGFLSMIGSNEKKSITE